MSTLSTLIRELEKNLELKRKPMHDGLGSCTECVCMLCAMIFKKFRACLKIRTLLSILACKVRACPRIWGLYFPF